MMTAQLISGDWGTTALRLYLLAGNGSILDRVETRQGIASVRTEAFANVLQTSCARWLERSGPLPVILSGMVGSRQGWEEVPYLTCPVGIEQLALATRELRVPGFVSVRIVGGLSTRDDIGQPDVMRGEECQVLGALAATGRSGGTFLLPGTHSKWVTVIDGRITDFKTYMTGEIFAALKDHTILGRMMGEAASVDDGVAFLRGVKAAERSQGAGAWLHRLFSVRTLGLMNELAPRDAANYLSGLMIGWEMAGEGLRIDHEVMLVGSPELTSRYRQASTALAIAVAEAPTDCVCAAHMQIASRAGLLAPA